jgi:Na+/H+ antiporter
MHGPEMILFLLAATTGIAIVARRLAIPYPIAFVLGGVVIACLPKSPSVSLDPDLIFILVLPPLLYSSGWATDLKAFIENLRPIAMLATGLVVATTCIVGLVAHFMDPAFGFAAAFVLGAIVSPPDAVAASTVFERFSVPSRILTILEGEGMVNDATALVIYGFAVAAVSTGTFHLGQALLQFLAVSLGGVALGIGFGYLLVNLLIGLRKSNLSDTLIDNLLVLIIPYGVYLLGGALHVSSVLATVTAGVYASRRSSELYTPDSRLTAAAFWQLLIFLLNAFVFLLIGLQLPQIMPHGPDLQRELILGTVVSVAIILIRIAWVYPSVYLPFVFSKVREKENLPTNKGVFVVAWSGMRGVVSLAAALALPRITASGAPFPGRASIIFVTFCVIFATLVVQGLTLIPLLKWFKLDGDNLSEREIEVRIAALEAGVTRLQLLQTEAESAEEVEIAQHISSEYTYRIAHLQNRVAETERCGPTAIDHYLQKEALMAEHDEVLRLRNIGEIPDEIFRRVRYDLDLAAARLT